MNPFTDIQKKRWLSQAESSQSELFYQKQQAQAIVRPVEDPQAFQGWGMSLVELLDSNQPSICLSPGDEVILDFGCHIVGSVEFEFQVEELVADSPFRLQLVFGEVPSEIAGSLDDYKGSLSRSWLQEEQCVIDFVPFTLKTTRRYAFRYLKIRHVAGPKWNPLQVSKVLCRTVTSADASVVSLMKYSDPELLELDAVSLRTLANCMQTVFEDGPKRDRRLWIGDLRLQALSNYRSFGQNQLVKRCLYLLAGVVNEKGQVPSSLFELPTPHASNDYIVDYTALYPVILSEYLAETGDVATALDLHEIAFYQLDIVLKHVDEDGLVHLPLNQWSFVDWCEDLHKQAAMQGLLICALNSSLQMAEKLQLTEQVSKLKTMRDQMVDAALKQFYNEEKQLWVSGSNEQISYASWAWMTLAQILPPEQSALLYKSIEKADDVVRPNGPYLYHYVVDALFQCGLRSEAIQLLKDYWGGMLSKGATTFWEVYSPEDDLLSPYNDCRINSYCHAWSCTPLYFIRSGTYLSKEAQAFIV